MTHSRGQTLIETVFFLPILLLVLFAIMYAANVGVVNGRAQLAVRYGGLTAFYATPNAFYSANNIYQFYSRASGGSGSSVCPTPPPGAYSDSSPFPGPASGTFWQPASISSPGGVPCAIKKTKLGGAGFLATHYLGSTQVATQATVDVPGYLQPIIGSSAVVTASETFVHAAYPSVILACTGNDNSVYARVYNALFPSATPPPRPACQ